MKRIDFENGTVTRNIFSAAIPMLVAQILSLLYNIVDRIYIARIPEVGTTALGAVGLCFTTFFLFHIFVDPNLIEIFVNDGEYVLSNVVYDLGVEIKGKVQGILTWNDELC